MLPDAAPQDVFDRLLRLPFVELSNDGLVVHDTIREGVAAALRASDPDRSRRYRVAAWRRLRDEIARSTAPGHAAVHRRPHLPPREPDDPRGLLPDGRTALRHRDRPAATTSRRSRPVATPEPRRVGRARRAVVGARPMGIPSRSRRSRSGRRILGHGRPRTRAQADPRRRSRGPALGGPPAQGTRSPRASDASPTVSSAPIPRARRRTPSMRPASWTSCARPWSYGRSCAGGIRSAPGSSTTTTWRRRSDSCGSPVTRSRSPMAGRATCTGSTSGRDRSTAG